MARKATNIGIGRKLLVTGAALVTVGGVITMAAPVTANAAPLANCGVSSSGTAGADQRSQPVDGTIFTKQSDSCHDFNVRANSTSADYVGWIFHSSTGRWSSCAKGDVFIAKGTFEALCTDVGAGTPMIATAAGHYSITAEY
jgi:hypothetical protein